MPVLVVDRTKCPAVVVHSSPNDEFRLPKKIKDVPTIVFQGKTRKVETYRVGKDVVVRPVYLKQRGLHWNEKLRLWLGLGLTEDDKTILLAA